MGGTESEQVRVLIRGCGSFAPLSELITGSNVASFDRQQFGVGDEGLRVRSSDLQRRFMNSSTVFAGNTTVDGWQSGKRSGSLFAKM